MKSDIEAIGLTGREKEIFNLLIGGKSSIEIADTLSISRHTVDTHRRKILKKLNLKNTVKLVALFYHSDR